MVDRALVAVCAGCCCGHPESGGPKTPPRTLKPAIRRRMKAAALDGQARVAFTDCLGPCSEANVVFLFLEGRPLWLRRMNTEALYDVFFAWLRRALIDGVEKPLPSALAERSFSWTGGGDGPPPPVVPEPSEVEGLTRA
jgi:cobaltochelatase CobN